MAVTEAARIPPAYRASCDLCGRSLDIRAHGVHQYTRGWVEQRVGGGGHAIRCAVRERRWAHALCVDRATRGQTTQGSLL